MKEKITELRFLTALIILAIIITGIVVYHILPHKVCHDEFTVTKLTIPKYNVERYYVELDSNFNPLQEIVCENGTYIFELIGFVANGNNYDSVCLIKTKKEVCVIQ